MMFGLKAYTVLLNEVFVTGYDDDELRSRLAAALRNEGEVVRRVGPESSLLRRLRNSDRVVQAFRRVAGVPFRLTRPFSGHIPAVSVVVFELITVNDCLLLALVIDGVEVCAVGPARPAPKH